MNINDEQKPPPSEQPVEKITKVPPVRREKLRVGITMGDINGIGVEVIIKTLRDNRIIDACTPIIYGSSRVVSYHRKVLKAESFTYNIIGDVDRCKSNTCNILNCWTEELSVSIGRPNKDSGIFVFRALEAAAYDLQNGKIDVLITAPVNKEQLNSIDTPFQGHTEFLADKFGGKSLMFMVSDNMRVGLVTNHVPVNKVAETINKELIINKLELMDQSLRADFGIDRPQIAVLGLNPHAGDNGLIGKEEQEIIVPAIEAFRNDNKLVFGPYPADGFFGNGMQQKFDGVLAMYHDQGLIPFKALSFGSGVNFTAGLPIVRTSPDHGTAYGIAGKNQASPDSFRKALFTAIDIYKQRIRYAEMTANPLEKGLSSKIEDNHRDYRRN